MFRRLAALVAVLSLLALASPAMTLAGTVTPASHAAFGFDNVQNCPLAESTHYWVGVSNSSPPPNNDRTAIQAFFRPSSTGFATCSDNWMQLPTFASWWVAFEPRSGGNYNTILQIGLVKCSPYFNSPSFCDSVPHYVWADGGCNGYTPNWRDLGPADWNRHPYVMFEFWNNGTQTLWYQLQVNGGNWNGYPQHVVDVNTADPAISCWIDKESGNYTGDIAVWSAEKVVTQDSIGDSNNVGLMDTTAYAVQNGGWQYPSWPAGYNCNYLPTDPHDHCAYTGTRSAEFWTAQ